MKVEKTSALDYNVRRTLLQLDFETYQALQAGEVVDVPDETAEVLITRGLATQKGD